jgi:hypothetical protein
MTVAAVLLAGLLASGGCMLLVGAGAAVGTTMYAEGSLTVMMDKNPPQIADATKAAFHDLGIGQGAVSVTAGQATLEGIYGSDSVKVTIEKQGDNVSKVWVRIGTFGDEQKSLNIYDKIKAHL